MSEPVRDQQTAFARRAEAVAKARAAENAPAVVRTVKDVEFLSWGPTIEAGPGGIPAVIKATHVTSSGDVIVEASVDGESVLGVDVAGRLYPAYVDDEGDILVQPRELGVTEPGITLDAGEVALVNAWAAHAARMASESDADNGDYDKSDPETPARGVGPAELDRLRELPPPRPFHLPAALGGLPEDTPEPLLRHMNRAERRRRARRA